MNSRFALASSGASLRPRKPIRHALNPVPGNHSTPIIDHWVLQLRGVEPHRLDDPERLCGLLKGCAAALELTCVSDHSHYFGPGVSTVLILSESHLSVHTWPELGYLHVDIVTCVRKLTEERLEAVFGEAFGPREVQTVQLEY